MERKDPWIHLGPPNEYLIALGQVITQWAYFETEFDGLLVLMMLDPEAQKLGSVRFSFKDRAKLFEKASKVCFGHCQPLLDRLLAIVSKARRVKTTRDHIAHCRWLGDAKDGTLATYIDSAHSLKTKEITLDSLRNSVVEISALSRETMAVISPFPDYSFPLMPKEQSAVREFRMRHMPSPPLPRVEDLLFRGEAKGSPKRVKET